MDTPRIAIVGAGPAGIRAAETLANAGLRPALIDESPEPGGQVYRRPFHVSKRSRQALHSFSSRKAERIHAVYDELVSRNAIDLRLRSLVWGGAGTNLFLAGPCGPEVVSADAVILATGAMDRIVPVPGWTLPGVYSLGGAQVVLKYQARTIGQRPIIAGSGPLLYLVAWQLTRAGVLPAAVLDSGSLSTRLKATSSLLAAPATFLRGLWYAASLRFAGVSVHSGAVVEAIEECANGLAVRYRQGSSTALATGDAVAISNGLQPEYRLAGLLGCALRFDSGDRQWVVDTDDDCRTSVPGVYAAGDGVAVRGSVAAETAGELAGLAALSDFGLMQKVRRRAILHRRMKRFDRFRRGLELAFPLGSAAHTSNETIICRCEIVRARDLRNAISQWSITDTNQLKAVTRCGMGRCQGRLCSGAAAEILAHTIGSTPDAVGLPRVQMPIKPLIVSSNRKTV